MRNCDKGWVARWQTGAPSILAQHRAATEFAMLQEIAAVRVGCERIHDVFSFTDEQLAMFERECGELELISGYDLADIYFKECVK